MRIVSARRSRLAAWAAAAALVCGALAAVGAAAQEPAPELVLTPAPEPALAPAPSAADAATAEAEARALDELAVTLAERRAALDARRRELARERALITAVGRPASVEEVAFWRERNKTAERLGGEVAALEAIAETLTPGALAAVSLPEGGTVGVLTPDPGLARTRLQVNLRNSPDGDRMAVLEADALVVHLATDADGWSVVATMFGIGFAPASQLRREP